MAPVIATNRVSADTQAYISNLVSLKAAKDLIIDAQGRAGILSSVQSSAVSIAVSGKGSGASVSVGLSMSRNDVDNDVLAYLSGSPGNTVPVVVGGNVRISTDRGASIGAEGSASSTSLSVGGGGTGVGVAAAGTLAFNFINGLSDAYIHGVALTTRGSGGSLGDVTVSTKDDAYIVADISTRSIALAGSSGAGTAVALGISVAKNIIGGDVLDVAYDYKVSDYNSTNKLTTLAKGKKVLKNTGVLTDEVYEYIGETQTNAKGIELSTQNYSDAGVWRLLSYSDRKAATRARISSASIDAAGNLSVLAEGIATIDATVTTLSAGVALSGAASTAASGAGVYAENRIQTGLEASIDGSVGTGRSKIVANGVTVSADNQATIDALAGAASLAAAVGANGAVSVSVGLSLAFNSIDGDTLATIGQADVQSRTGDVHVNAQSGGEKLLSLEWKDILAKGITADMLDAAGSAGSYTTYNSSEGQEWDYLQSEGKTQLSSGDLVRANTGRIYKYVGTSGVQRDLGTQNYTTDSVWKEVETDAVKVMSGYTVRVDPLHSYGGEAGKVYRYIGGTVDHTTLEGKVFVDIGQLVRVESNFQDSSLLGKIYKFKGVASNGTNTSAVLDLRDQNFEDTSLWTAYSESKTLDLWRENYANTAVWQLATEFTDVKSLRTITDGLQALGLEISALDNVQSSYLYKSTDGMSWDYLSSQSEAQSLKSGKKVNVVSGALAGNVYQYIDKTTRKLELGTENYADTTRWKLVKAETRQLEKGDTVRVSDLHKAGGNAGATYRYIGKNHQAVDLSKANYTDSTRWEIVKPVLRISQVIDGMRWMIHDEGGRSYTLARLDDGTVELTRNNITATSAAASMAASISGMGAVAVSGAGAVALNLVMGSTDAVVRQGSIVAKGDVVVEAHNASIIATRIAALSAAIAGGGAGAVGASIGVSVARNLIGQEGFGAVGEQAIATTRALLIDANVSAGQDVQLKASAEQTIEALVVAGSAALAVGGAGGVAASGSGVWAQNQIGMRVQAGVDTQDSTVGTRPTRVMARNVGVYADDQSRIRSHAGAASLAGAFAGASGTAVSVGVSIARNVIDSLVFAGLKGIDLNARGTVDVRATSNAAIRVTAWAASLAAGVGGANGIGVSGAGAVAMNVILGDVLAQVDDSALRAASDVTVKAQATNDILARIVAASVGVGVGGPTAWAPRLDLRWRATSSAMTPWCGKGR